MHNVYKCCVRFFFCQRVMQLQKTQNLHSLLVKINNDNNILKHNINSLSNMVMSNKENTIDEKRVMELIDEAPQKKHKHNVNDISDLDLDKYTSVEQMNSQISNINSTITSTKQELTNNINGKANVSHTHNISDINDIDIGNYVTTEQLDTKANVSHTHNISDVTDLQTTLNESINNAKQELNNTITSTKDELTQSINNKSDSSHTHNEYVTTQQLNTTKQELNNSINNKANNNHTHTISDITDFGTSGIDTSNLVTKQEFTNKIDNVELNFNTVTSQLTTSINTKADTSHKHTIDNITNLQTTLNDKANSTHVHNISDVSNLQTTLDGKANASHTHNTTDISDRMNEHHMIIGRRYDYEGLDTSIFTRFDTQEDQRIYMFGFYNEETLYPFSLKFTCNDSKQYEGNNTSDIDEEVISENPPIIWSCANVGFMIAFMDPQKDINITITELYINNVKKDDQYIILRYYPEVPETDMNVDKVITAKAVQQYAYNKLPHIEHTHNTTDISDRINEFILNDREETTKYTLPSNSIFTVVDRSIQRDIYKSYTFSMTFIVNDLIVETLTETSGGGGIGRDDVAISININVKGNLKIIDIKLSLPRPNGPKTSGVIKMNNIVINGETKPNETIQYTIIPYTPPTSTDQDKVMSIKAIDEMCLTRRNFLDIVYPVGSIYTSMNKTDPGTLFGGTWKRITDCFLWCTHDDQGVAGEKGGSKKITVDNLPSHNHTFTGVEMTGEFRTNNNTAPFHGGNENWASAQGVFKRGEDLYSYGTNSYGSSIKLPALRFEATPEGIISNTGRGTDYMPPYIRVYAWNRTA